MTKYICEMSASSCFYYKEICYDVRPHKCKICLYTVCIPYGNLMIDAEITETWRWIAIYDKVYFIDVRLLGCYIVWSPWKYLVKSR
jgi:hypothetical protein